MIYRASYKRIRFGSPWNRRIYDVIGSQGWTLEEAAPHFGFSTHVPLMRILKGGRPSVKFLVTLEKLESAYEREIKSYIANHRKTGYLQHIRKYRLKWAIKRGERHPNPAQVGVLAALREIAEDERRQRETRARKMLRRNAKKRRNRAARKEARARQSYVEWKKQRLLTQKLERAERKRIENERSAKKST